MGFFSKLFQNKETTDGNRIAAPMAGRAVAITEVPDPAFAGKLLGDGIAIIPTDGRVYAPCDAAIDTVFESGHAVSLVSSTGVELLIHVGLETVNLNGAPFTIRVRNGQKVRKGQLLMEADLEMIKAAGLNTITPVIVCNADTYLSFKTVCGREVAKDDVVIEVTK